MKSSLHILFWVLVHAVLTTYFGGQFNSFQHAFYFVSMLLPVVIGTSYFFNLYLIPTFLLAKKYFKFCLYTLYLIVVSLYLEIVVITLAFIYLAEYSYDNMAPSTTDVFMMAIALYFIVLLYSFVTLVRRSFSHEQEIHALEEEKEKYEAGSFTVRSNRKLMTLNYEEVAYIESLGDYVKIHLVDGGNLMTKEKISSLEERLPDLYLRIHRSFIVNKNMINAFNKEEVEVNQVSLPISRTYKKAAWAVLSKPE